jgi:hypothetical protein
LVKESLAAQRPCLDVAEERGVISKSDAMDVVNAAALGH